MEAQPESNNTWNSSEDTTELLERNIVNSFICVVCICGVVGNGTVIWLLGFRMKRNPFTTYILNLAVADFGILISLNLMALVFQFAYSTSQFLLTAISVDRCVSLLFPFWYRCHRPLHLSSTICAILWIFCLLLYGLNWILPVREERALPLFYVFLVTAVVCLPLITISTLILFLRVCFKSQQRQRGKILLVILLTLFFFLILAFPLNAICLVTYHTVELTYHDLVIYRYLLQEYGSLCASLNSFVNPLIYFLVGRRKKGLCSENVKLILQRIFKDEEAPGEELQYTVQSQV
ncbi:mas-related G-protein coupled receptor member H-like [Tiliqua scincoides]|uniref:mas-related G-protein coupled receptor member H-like n=1 Tax=Tiliqua scincoides TaxID=71010 RepID=UPI0034632D8D